MKIINLFWFVLLFAGVAAYADSFSVTQKKVALEDYFDVLSAVQTMKFEINNEMPLKGEIVVWKKIDGEVSVIHRQGMIPLRNLTFTVLEHPEVLEGPEDSDERVIRIQVGGKPVDQDGWSAMGGEARPYYRDWEKGVSHRHVPQEFTLGSNPILIQGLPLPDDRGSDFFQGGFPEYIKRAWRELNEGMLIEIVLEKPD